MTKLQLSPDVAALNTHLAQAIVTTDSPYRSKLEARAVRDWLPTQEPVQWWYEPISFSLPGGRYTPDLFLLTQARTISIVEVKGYNLSTRASRKAFLEAARTHRWARFCWLTWDKRQGWVEEWIT